MKLFRRIVFYMKINTNHHKLDRVWKKFYTDVINMVNLYYLRG